MDDADRIRKLKLHWLRELVASTERMTRESEPPPGSSIERLSLALSDEIDRMMDARGVTHRTIGVSRRTLARALAGDSITTTSLVEIADALNCDVLIRFRPRDESGATNGASGAKDGTSAGASEAPPSSSTNTPRDEPPASRAEG